MQCAALVLSHSLPQFEEDEFTDIPDRRLWDLTLSTRAYNVLAHLSDAWGIAHEDLRASHICRLSAGDIFRQKGVGPVALAEIKAELERVGWKLADRDISQEDSLAMFRVSK